MTFDSRVPFAAEHPTSLAVYCSDGRFTESVEDLLKHLGHPRLDTLTIPGGAALLELTSASASGAETVRQSVSFLITAHHISEVVLVAHAGCGYYKSRLPYDSPASLERRQLSDLRTAAKWLTQEHGKLRVHRFFARPDAGHVRFEAVE